MNTDIRRLVFASRRSDFQDAYIFIHLRQSAIGFTSVIRVHSCPFAVKFAICYLLFLRSREFECLRKSATGSSLLVLQLQPA